MHGLLNDAPLENCKATHYASGSTDSVNGIAAKSFLPLRSGVNLIWEKFL